MPGSSLFLSSEVLQGATVKQTDCSRVSILLWFPAGNLHLTSSISAQTTESISTHTSIRVTKASGTLAGTLSPNPDPTHPDLTPPTRTRTWTPLDPHNPPPTLPAHHASFTPPVCAYRQSTDAPQQHPSFRLPMDPQPDPYVTPPQYRDAGPAIDGNSAARLLSYPPLQASVERRRSASNSDMGPRRSFAANLQMVEPYSGEVHRPTYTQR